MIYILHFKANASEDDKADFNSELDTMKRIGRHRNIVSLIGACEHEGMKNALQTFQGNVHSRWWSRGTYYRSKAT